MRSKEREKTNYFGRDGMGERRGVEKRRGKMGERKEEGGGRKKIEGRRKNKKFKYIRGKGVNFSSFFFEPENPVVEKLKKKFPSGKREGKKKREEKFKRIAFLKKKLTFNLLPVVSRHCFAKGRKRVENQKGKEKEKGKKKKKCLELPVIRFYIPELNPVTVGYRTKSKGSTITTNARDTLRITVSGQIFRMGSEGGIGGETKRKEKVV